MAVKLLVIDDKLDIIEYGNKIHKKDKEYLKKRFREESAELKLILQELSESIQISLFSSTLKNDIEVLFNPEEI